MGANSSKKMSDDSQKRFVKSYVNKNPKSNLIIKVVMLGDVKIDEESIFTDFEKGKLFSDYPSFKNVKL